MNVVSVLFTTITMMFALLFLPTLPPSLRGTFILHSDLPRRQAGEAICGIEIASSRLTRLRSPEYTEWTLRNDRDTRCCILKNALLTGIIKAVLLNTDNNMTHATLHSTNLIAKKQEGFTLIELLIVIAVLGVLAAALLVAINPVEQLARGRDAGRVSTTGQLGRAIQANYTANSAYLTQGTTWLTALVTSNDIKIAPSNPTGGTGYTQGCNTASVAQNGICYITNGTDAIIFMSAESGLQKTKCTAGQGAWITWSSAAGSTGIACTTNATTDPAVGVTGLK